MVLGEIGGLYNARQRYLARKFWNVDMPGMLRRIFFDAVQRCEETGEYSRWLNALRREAPPP